MIPLMIVADADQSAPSALAVVLLVVAVAALTLLASQLRGRLRSRTEARQWSQQPGGQLEEDP